MMSQSAVSTPDQTPLAPPAEMPPARTSTSNGFLPTSAGLTPFSRYSFISAGPSYRLHAPMPLRPASVDTSTITDSVFQMMPLAAPSGHSSSGLSRYARLITLRSVILRFWRVTPSRGEDRPFGSDEPPRC